MTNQNFEIRKIVLKELADEFLGPQDRQALARSIYVHFALEGGIGLAELASSLRMSHAAVMNDNMRVRSRLENGDDVAKTAVAKVRAALSRQDGVTRTVTASCEIHNGRMFSTINLLTCLTDMQRLVAVLAAWHLRGGIALGGGEAVACFPMPPDDPAIEAVVAKINELGQSGGEMMLNAFRSLYTDVYRVG